jgi:hypothetical protein
MFESAILTKEDIIELAECKVEVLEGWPIQSLLDDMHA